jgi:hypothetical protein
MAMERLVQGTAGEWCPAGRFRGLIDLSLSRRAYVVFTVS